MRHTAALAAIALLLGVIGIGIERTASGFNNYGIVSVGPTGGNGPYAPVFRATTPNGRIAWFETDEQLTPGDSDGVRTDLYEWRDGVVSLVSTGPFAGAGTGADDATFGGASTDGSRVFFSTTERLVAEDDDGGKLDVYQRSGGTTTLLSTGPFAGATTGSFDVFPAGASLDGTRVFFVTPGRLVAADDEGVVGYDDVYERSGGQTYLVSTGSFAGAGTSATVAAFNGASEDGGIVVFTTSEKLEAADGDVSKQDVYVRSGRTTTTLASTGSFAGAGTGPHDSFFAGMSVDGLHVYFDTVEKLESPDLDANAQDIYDRFGGATVLVTTGSDPAAATGAYTFSNFKASATGDRAFFATTAKLESADGDANNYDVYERSSGSTRLVSTGSAVGAGTAAIDATLQAISRDGTRALFTTTEKLESTDGDAASLDVYQRMGSGTTLLSTGSFAGAGTAAIDIFFDGASADGTRVYFTTPERLESADNDGGKRDVYERLNGVTSVASAGPLPSSLTAPYDAFFNAVSADGTRAFFDTQAKYVSADTDDELDTYVSAAESVGFTAGAASAREDGGSRQLTVSLNAPAPQAVTVHYSATGGTASAGDFTLGGSGTLTIPPFTMTGTITLTPVNDFLVESSETVVLTLTNPTAATLAAPTLTVTIADNEPKATCNGKAATIVGSNGVDTLKGTAGPDVILGRRGSDTIKGLAGNDVLCGAGGNDILLGAGGNDVLVGGNGNDQLTGSAGKDDLDGGLGRDRLAGGPGAGDRCNGGPGTDTLPKAHGCEQTTAIP